jgi:hypothetical protein
MLCPSHTEMPNMEALRWVLLPITLALLAVIFAIGAPFAVARELFAR